MNSKQFSELFLDDSSESFLFNDDPEAIGFSFIKEYPENNKRLISQPLRNQRGDVDSVALIKIYFLKNEINDIGLVPLYIYIGCSSKYLLSGKHRYNFDDQESPSAEALRDWQKMPKPVSLDDVDSYLFNTKSKEIIERQTHKIEEPKKIVDTIFNLHIKTVGRFDGLFFRSKIRTRFFLSERILKISKILFAINSLIFSREIPEMRSLEDLSYKHHLKPAPHNLLRIKQPKNLNIFGTDLPVSENSVLYTAFLFLIINFIGRFYSPIISALDWALNQSALLATSVVIIWFYFFDNFLPHFLLFISNQIVRIAGYFRSIKIKI